MMDLFYSRLGQIEFSLNKQEVNLEEPDEGKQIDLGTWDVPLILRLVAHAPFVYRTGIKLKP